MENKKIIGWSIVGLNTLGLLWNWLSILKNTNPDVTYKINPFLTVIVVIIYVAGFYLIIKKEEE